jgi:hypothetical protein
LSLVACKSQSGRLDSSTVSNDQRKGGSDGIPVLEKIGNEQHSTIKCLLYRKAGSGYVPVSYRQTEGNFQYLYFPAIIFKPGAHDLFIDDLSTTILGDDLHALSGKQIKDLSASSYGFMKNGNFVTERPFEQTTSLEKRKLVITSDEGGKKVVKESVIFASSLQSEIVLEAVEPAFFTPFSFLSNYLGTNEKGEVKSTAKFNADRTVKSLETSSPVILSPTKNPDVIHFQVEKSIFYAGCQYVW